MPGGSLTSPPWRHRRSFLKTSASTLSGCAADAFHRVPQKDSCASSRSCRHAGMPSASNFPIAQFGGRLRSATHSNWGQQTIDTGTKKSGRFLFPACGYCDTPFSWAVREAQFFMSHIRPNWIQLVLEYLVTLTAQRAAPVVIRKYE